MIVPVILAGGSGSRLWPLSRSAYPKQLLPLVSGKTMLQDTVLRANSACKTEKPIIVCNQDHRFLVAEQLHEIGCQQPSIILEPFGRDTAPAIAIAALHLLQNNQDVLLLVLPADHVIKELDHFATSIAIAKQYAEADMLVTFGVTPTCPETGYGYIKTGLALDNEKAYKVVQFVEKPNRAKAEEYFASGEYYWNSGMFMFRASRFLAELKSYEPDIFATCAKTAKKMVKDLDFIRLDNTLFQTCPSKSIDYAIMEKTQDSILIPLNAEWSDVGSWAALWDIQKNDEHGNVLHGDVITEQVSNSYLRAENRMLAVVGVTDHIVIETADAVLVAHKNNSQAVKDMVMRLKQNQRPETELHRKVYRPWGNYEILDRADCFQVKHITVKKGASLSLQMHYHRSEHWIVVKGEATVTRGEDVFIIKENQSTYIPLGTKHRLANFGNIDLEIIEVQSGVYLGEDDIVRFEDAYGRVAVTE